MSVYESMFNIYSCFCILSLLLLVPLCFILKKHDFVLWTGGWSFANGYFQLVLVLVIATLLIHWWPMTYILFSCTMFLISGNAWFPPLHTLPRATLQTNKQTGIHFKILGPYIEKLSVHIQAEFVFLKYLCGDNFLCNNSIADWGYMIFGWKNLEKCSLLESWAYFQLCWLLWGLIALE